MDAFGPMFSSTPRISHLKIPLCRDTGKDRTATPCCPARMSLSGKIAGARPSGRYQQSREETGDPCQLPPSFYIVGRRKFLHTWSILPESGHHVPPPVALRESFTGRRAQDVERRKRRRTPPCTQAGRGPAPGTTPHGITPEGGIRCRPFRIAHEESLMHPAPALPVGTGELSGNRSIVKGQILSREDDHLQRRSGRHRGDAGTPLWTIGPQTRKVRASVTSKASESEFVLGTLHGNVETGGTDRHPQGRKQSARRYQDRAHFFFPVIGRRALFKGKCGYIRDEVPAGSPLARRLPSAAAVTARKTPVCSLFRFKSGHGGWRMAKSSVLVRSGWMTRTAHAAALWHQFDLILLVERTGADLWPLARRVKPEPLSRSSRKADMIYSDDFLLQMDRCSAMGLLENQNRPGKGRQVPWILRWGLHGLSISMVRWYGTLRVLERARCSKTVVERLEPHDSDGRYMLALFHSEERA